MPHALNDSLNRLLNDFFLPKHVDKLKFLHNKAYRYTESPLYTLMFINQAHPKAKVWSG